MAALTRGSEGDRVAAYDSSQVRYVSKAAFICPARATVRHDEFSCCRYLSRHVSTIITG